MQGTSLDIGHDATELGLRCQLDKVRKVYKLGSADGGAATTTTKTPKTNAFTTQGCLEAINHDSDRAEIETVVLGMIALKGS